MRPAQAPRAIIFDLDDTIIDDSGAMETCWVEVCVQAAERISGLDAETLSAAIDRRREVFWSDPERHREGRMDLRAATRKIVDAALKDMGFVLPHEAREIAETYRDLREDRLCLFPGAIDTLKRIRSEGIAMGLITNGGAAGQRSKIERFGLAPYFRHILIEGEFGIGKPDPQVVQTMLQALATEPAEAWSVGDNLEWDVAAPQRLGVFGIWVDRSGAGTPAGSTICPDRTIASIKDLL